MGCTVELEEYWNYKSTKTLASGRNFKEYVLNSKDGSAHKILFFILLYVMYLSMLNFI